MLAASEAANFERNPRRVPWGARKEETLPGSPLGRVLILAAPLARAQDPLLASHR